MQSKGRSGVQPFWRDACFNTLMEKVVPRSHDPHNGNNGESGEVMMLSNDAILIFILQSGVSGRSTKGRVERDMAPVINVYDEYGGYQPYFSGRKLRSWCIAGPTGRPIHSWSSILPEDRRRMLKIG